MKNSEINKKKIEKLAKLLDCDISSFSNHNRVDDYLELSISFGFDLDAFYNTPLDELDFQKIKIEGEYLDDFLNNTIKEETVDIDFH